MNGKKVVRMAVATLFGMMTFALASAITGNRSLGAIIGGFCAGIVYHLSGKK
jgi:hypothetical protein